MTSRGTSFFPCRRNIMHVSSFIDTCCAACMFDIPCIGQGIDCRALFRCHPRVMAGEYGQPDTALIQVLRDLSHQRLHYDARGDSGGRCDFMRKTRNTNQGISLWYAGVNNLITYFEQSFAGAMARLALAAMSQRGDRDRL